ncbi:hypothetical protein Tco_0324149 [Tanacetum coccineum]
MVIVKIQRLLSAVGVTAAQVQLKEFDPLRTGIIKWYQSLLRSCDKEEMDQDSAHMVAASKVPMLKPSEYEIWRMRIKQYIQMIDYALWEVIENGATFPKTKIVDCVMIEMPIATTEEKA